MSELLRLEASLESERYHSSLRGSWSDRDGHATLDVM